MVRPVPMSLLSFLLILPSPVQGEVVRIPAQDTPEVWSSALESDAWHLLVVRGTYARNGDGALADAEFIDTGEGWVEFLDDECREEACSPYDLLVCGGPQEWWGSVDGTAFAPHTYSPDHVYILYWLGEGKPISFRIRDLGVPGGADNSEHLTVEIRRLEGLPELAWTRNPATGHLYALTPVHCNWETAERMARSFGGHLAVLDDEAENGWATSTFAAYGPCCWGNPWDCLGWIGLEKIGDRWQWVDGTSLAYPPPWWLGDVGCPHAYAHLSCHPDAGTWWNPCIHDQDPQGFARGILEVGPLQPAFSLTKETDCSVKVVVTTQTFIRGFSVGLRIACPQARFAAAYPGAALRRLGAGPQDPDSVFLQASYEEGRGIEIGCILSMTDFDRMLPPGTHELVDLSVLGAGDGACGIDFAEDVGAAEGNEDSPNRLVGPEGDSILPATKGIAIEPGLCKKFLRGDANADGRFDIADPVYALGYLFADFVLACDDAADANDDGDIDIADPIGMLFTQFAAAGPLPPPYRACGLDPTPDAFACVAFPACQ